MHRLAASEPGNSVDCNIKIATQTIGDHSTRRDKGLQRLLVTHAGYDAVRVHLYSALCEIRTCVEGIASVVTWPDYYYCRGAIDPAIGFLQ